MVKKYNEDDTHLNEMNSKLLKLNLSDEKNQIYSLRLVRPMGI